MKSEVLKHFPFPWLTAAGLLLFVALFVGILLWVRRPGSKELYERLSKLPLDSSDTPVTGLKENRS